MKSKYLQLNETRARPPPMLHIQKKEIENALYFQSHYNIKINTKNMELIISVLAIAYYLIATVYYGYKVWKWVKAYLAK